MMGYFEPCLSHTISHTTKKFIKQRHIKRSKEA